MEKKWNVQHIPSQSGKTAIVTGANTGIGYETALALAGKGAQVILAGRNKDKNMNAINRIKREYPEAKVEYISLDLASLDSVQAFVKAFREKYPALDILINNAGVMVPPMSRTKEGFELQFGVNHLGHFALSSGLIDLLEASKGRLVQVSSMAHRTGKIQFEDLNWEKNKYSAWRAYGQSKLANLLFAFELQRRLDAKGIKVRCMGAHPGWTKTDLQRNSGLFRFLNPIFAQKPNMGALPTLYAATAPEAEPAQYYGPGGFGEMKGHPSKSKIKETALDQGVAKQLWEESEKLTGIQFPV